MLHGRLPVNKVTSLGAYPGLATLGGKTLFITGASRGIGLAIAKRAAMDGANIVIIANTTDPNPKLPGTIWGPLVFSAITGGTQNQHWCGGGVGRSLISLTFLFTFKSAIRGVKPWSVSSIGASYRCIWSRRQDLVSIAVNWEAKHTPQVDALQSGGGNFSNQFRWNDLAAVRPAIQDRLHL